MKRATAPALRWLALLLAAYLCAPFIVSAPEILRAQWSALDWPTALSAIAVSLASATLASLIILIGGVPLGYWLARSRSRATALLGFMVQLPLALPPLASGVLLLFLLGPYSVVGRVFGGRLTDSFTGIVCAEAFVAAPFLVIAARSAFASQDPVFEDVAATLGHRPLSRFFRVALPSARSGIGAGLALSWLRAFGEFGATVMVAYHPYSLPVYTYVVFGSQGLPAMMPLLLPTLAIVGLGALISLVAAGAAGAAGAAAPVSLDPVQDRELAPARPRTPAAPAHLSFRLASDLGAFRLDVAWSPGARRLALVGPSGAGKSLTLRLLAGLDPNPSGGVTLGDLDLGGLPPERRQIAYMPQDYGLFPHMTVAQQLAFPVSADPARARYWIAHLGLADLLERLPRQLSFGQRQRVALARALAMQSRLMLFDEPFAALDTPRRSRLQRSLLELQREISAVTLIVTHDPDEAALLADEILIIDGGRALQSGAVSDVFERPASVHAAALLGVANVGEGVVEAPGKVRVTGGLVLETHGRSIEPGRAVMWRVAPHAIAPSPSGPHEGRTMALELRRGEPVARVEIEGVQLEAKPRSAGSQVGERVRFAVDPEGVSIWTAGD